MCRLFGFRSVIPSKVHRSLLAADNALAVQSDRHPDGWGVVYYAAGTPHLIRSPSAANRDQLFRKLSGVVASETVLAHIRKATVGNISLLNCHPFQHGRWTMAHNGEIKNYEKFREAITQRIAPKLRRFILGDTDSETIFYLFLTQLSLRGPLHERFSIMETENALIDTVRMLRKLCDVDGEESLLSMIITDGTTMAATQGGKELFYSTYKTRCADRDECPNLSPQCEAPSETGFVNHFLVSSEPVIGENVWTELERDKIIGVDWRMRLRRASIQNHDLQVVE